MLCVPGDLHRPLYLIHTGAVAILDAVPQEGKDQAWQRPRVVLRRASKASKIERFTLRSMEKP